MVFSPILPHLYLIAKRYRVSARAKEGLGAVGEQAAVAGEGGVGDDFEARWRPF